MEARLDQSEVHGISLGTFNTREMIDLNRQDRNLHDSNNQSTISQAMQKRLNYIKKKKEAQNSSTVQCTTSTKQGDQ